MKRNKTFKSAFRIVSFTLIMLFSLIMAFPFIDAETGNSDVAITAKAASNIAQGKKYKYDKKPWKGDGTAAGTYATGVLTNNATNDDLPFTSTSWNTWTYDKSQNGYLRIVIDLDGYFKIEEVELVMQWTVSGALKSGSAQRPNIMKVDFSNTSDSYSGDTGTDMRDYSTTVNIDKTYNSVKYTCRRHNHKKSFSNEPVRYVKFYFKITPYTFTGDGTSNQNSDIRIYLNEIYVRGTACTLCAFDVNGYYNGTSWGSPSMDYGTFNYSCPITTGTYSGSGKDAYSSSIVKNSTFKISNFSINPGYYYGGYSVKSGTSVPAYENNLTPDNTGYPNGNFTVDSTKQVVLYLENYYSITYKFGNGDDDSTVTYHWSQQFSPPAIVRGGCTLTGWLCSNGDTYGATETLSKLSTAVGGSLTFTAIWKKKFDVNTFLGTTYMCGPFSSASSGTLQYDVAHNCSSFSVRQTANGITEDLPDNDNGHDFGVTFDPEDTVSYTITVADDSDKAYAYAGYVIDLTQSHCANDAAKIVATSLGEMPIYQYLDDYGNLDTTGEGYAIDDKLIVGRSKTINISFTRTSQLVLIFVPKIQYTVNYYFDNVIADALTKTDIVLKNSKQITLSEEKMPAGMTASNEIFMYNGVNYSFKKAMNGASVTNAETVTASDDGSLVLGMYFEKCFKYTAPARAAEDAPVGTPDIEISVSDSVGADSESKAYYGNNEPLQIKLKFKGINESNYQSKRLSANSVIKVNGQRVFPLTALPKKYGDDYYIIVEYTNGMDYAAKGASADLIRFKNSDILIETDIEWEENGAASLFGNFAPLGVKTNSGAVTFNKGTDKEFTSPAETTMRFGTVWYINDYAWENTWVRPVTDKKPSVGTMVLQLRQIIRNPENNRYLDYINTQSDALSVFIRTNCTVGENIDLSGNWTINGVTKTRTEWALQSVQEFITYENSLPYESTHNREEIISFGGRELRAEALYYYYKNDPANGAEFIEYSAVLTGIDEDYKKDIALIAVPYIGILKNWYHGYAPTEAGYDDFIYSYHIPENAYTLNGILG